MWRHSDDYQMRSGTRPKTEGQVFQGYVNRSYHNQARGGQRGYNNSRWGRPRNNFNRDKKFCFSQISWMTPLIQAPSVIPQLTLSWYTVSITTYNKLFEIMTPNNGNKIRPRITVTKTFSWLFHTRAAMTCMNKCSFGMAFKNTQPPKISERHLCHSLGRHYELTRCVGSGSMDQRK